MDETATIACAGCHSPGVRSDSGAKRSSSSYDEESTALATEALAGVFARYGAIAASGLVPISEQKPESARRIDTSESQVASGSASAPDNSSEPVRRQMRSVSVTNDCCLSHDSFAPGCFVCAGDAATPSLDVMTDVMRHETLDPVVSIAHIMEFSSDAGTVQLRGAVPVVIDQRAEQGSVEAYGDIESQTVSALTAVAETLYTLDMTMGDVVEITVYLVSPSGPDALNLSGFIRGYSHFFGTTWQPNVPIRSVVEVTHLAVPGWLVEMELTASVPIGSPDSSTYAHADGVEGN